MDQRGGRERSTPQRWLSPFLSLGSTNRREEVSPHQLQRFAGRLMQTEGPHEGRLSRNELAQRLLPPAGAEGPCRANRQRTSRIAVANQSFIFRTQDRRLATASKTPKSGMRLSPFQGIHRSMIPRLSPIVTAWVRSLAPSLESILVT